MRSCTPRRRSVGQGSLSPRRSWRWRERRRSPLGSSCDRGAFGRLAERLARRGLTGDVYVVGGAALAMAYARRTTRNIDAVFEPRGAVIEEAWAVATELGLPRWWLK